MSEGDIMDEIEIVELDDEVQVKSKPTAYEDQSDILPIKGYLGLETPSKKELQQLKEVAEYLGVQTKGSDEIAWLTYLRNLENRLRPPRIGETRLGIIREFVQLSQDIKKTEELRETMLQ